MPCSVLGSGAVDSRACQTWASFCVPPPLMPLSVHSVDVDVERDTGWHWMPLQPPGTSVMGAYSTVGTFRSSHNGVPKGSLGLGELTRPRMMSHHGAMASTSLRSMELHGIESTFLNPVHDRAANIDPAWIIEKRDSTKQSH